MTIIILKFFPTELFWPIPKFPRFSIGKLPQGYINFPMVQEIQEDIRRLKKGSIIFKIFQEGLEKIKKIQEGSISSRSSSSKTNNLQYSTTAPKKHSPLHGIRASNLYQSCLLLVPLLTALTITSVVFFGRGADTASASTNICGMKPLEKYLHLVFWC